MLVHPPLDDLRGVVCRPVIDDQDFGIPGLRLHTLQDALERTLDAGALVVRRDDDADLRMCHREGTSLSKHDLWFGGGRVRG